jgi:hypothetical protein
MKLIRNEITTRLCKSGREFIWWEDYVRSIHGTHIPIKTNCKRNGGPTTTRGRTSLRGVGGKPRCADITPRSWWKNHDVGHHSEELVEKPRCTKKRNRNKKQIKERDKPTPTVKKINVMQLTYRLTNSNEKQKAQTVQLNEEFWQAKRRGNKEGTPFMVYSPPNLYACLLAKECYYTLLFWSSTGNPPPIQHWITPIAQSRRAFDDDPM